LERHLALQVYDFAQTSGVLLSVSYTGQEVVDGWYDEINNYDFIRNTGGKAGIYVDVTSSEF
jgi:hypothetical protein